MSTESTAELIKIFKNVKSVIKWKGQIDPTRYF